VTEIFLTKRQQEVINAQMPLARNHELPHRRLGVTESTVHSINTEIFENFVQALEVMADKDVFELFKGRFKKHHTRVWESTRKIRSKMKV